MLPFVGGLWAGLFDSVRFGSFRFGSDQFGSIQFGSIQFDSIRSVVLILMGRSLEKTPHVTQDVNHYSQYMFYVGAGASCGLCVCCLVSRYAIFILFHVASC